MADVDFRVKFPFASNTVSALVEVDAELPTFTEINALAITDNLPAGDYALTVTYEWNMADVNDSAVFRVISPVTVGTEYSKEPKDNSDLVINTLSFVVPWSGGPITFSLQASTTVGASTLNISTSQICWERKV